MAYSKSYLFIGVVLFVILSSQVLAHELPETGATRPDKKMVLDGPTRDFIRAIQYQESNSRRGNTMLPHGLTDSEIDRFFHRTPRGTIAGAGAGIVKKNYGFLPESKEREDRHVDCHHDVKPSEVEYRRTFPANSNGAKIVPGNRKLLENFDEEIKMPGLIN